MNEPESIKVVLVGESGVGKTSIISQFVSKKFDPHRETSLSAQFVSKNVQFSDLGKEIKFDIWDTVGQEKYRSLAKIFYKDAKVIVFVYDITTEYSFNELKNYWYEETKSNSDGNPIFAVVGNKIDLYQNQKVSNNDGKEFAEKIGAIFQTTSALSDSGINTLFDNIGKTYLVPDFDYRATDKKAQEEYIKKKQEESNKNAQKKRSKGIQLDKKRVDEQTIWIDTGEVPLTLVTDTDGLYLRLFTPGKPVFYSKNVQTPFPGGDISVLACIPAVGTKFSRADEEGPAGEINHFDGEKVHISFFVGFDHL